MKNDLPILAPTAEDIERGRLNWIKEERNNPNAFSYWFPKLKEGLKGEAFILPKSIIFPLPINLMCAPLCETNEDLEEMLNWILRNRIVERIIDEIGTECFIKNGCFSNKFMFNSSCHIKDISAKSVLKHMREITENSLICDTGGNLEFVVREYIYSFHSLGEMYDGMPIRPELRVFYDFDKRKVLYSANYWDWDYCKSHLYGEDYDALEKATPELVFVYNNIHEKIENLLEFALQEVDLKGKWSIDVMIEGSNYYIIDMAIAEMSAYWKPEKVEENELS